MRDSRFIGLSTPAGRRGWFFDRWTDSDGEWAKVQVLAQDCERISKEFLELERRELGELLYRQEYLCEFIQDGESLFSSDIIGRIFRGEFAPLFAA